jgi:hypothetical protein
MGQNFIFPLMGYPATGRPKLVVVAQKPIFNEKKYVFAPKIQQNGQFPLAPVGVLAPGSAHARPSAQPPIDTSGNFSVQVSAE